MSLAFEGKGNPLSDEGTTAVTGELGIGLPEMWSVLTVETSGCGFLSDRRPKILFERHIFHRETQGRFDVAAPDISDAKPGGYGASGIHQYERLARAIDLDRQAALRSASWGIGQVMGFNAETAGYGDVEAMVSAMQDSEDEQLRGMFAFIRASNLHGALRQRNWAKFAQGYNGKAFAENQYDTKLAQAFVRYSTHGLPDLRLRATQVYLTYRGFDPQGVDGIMGNNTRTALRRFQAANDLPATGQLDEATFAALATG